MEKDLIDYSIDITCREGLRCDDEFMTYSDTRNEKPNLENACESLTQWVKSVLSILNKHLFNSLRNEYEYLTSEEAIVETIQANEYEFDEDGTF